MPCGCQYKVVAEQTREVFRRYDPKMTSMSLDEAYLDVTEYWKQHGAHYRAMAAATPDIPPRAATFGHPSAERQQGRPTRGPGAPLRPGEVVPPHRSSGRPHDHRAPAGKAEGAGGGSASSAAAVGDHSRGGGGGNVASPQHSAAVPINAGDADGTLPVDVAAGNSANEDVGGGSGDRSADEDDADDFHASGFSFSQNLGDDADASSEGSGDGSSAEPDGARSGEPSGASPEGLAGGILPLNPGASEAFNRDSVFERGVHLLVQEIRDSVFEATQLTCSAGIGPNPMLAKIASDKHKPDGQFLIPFDNASINQFMASLPVRRIPGVGKVTEKMLCALGCATAGELFANRMTVARVFSPGTSDWMLRVSMGIANSFRLPFAATPNRKSMSIERTFSEIADVHRQEAKCRELCDRLAADLQEAGLKGRTITVKLKHVDFRVYQRSRSRKSYVNTGDALFETAVQILRTMTPCRLRLMGIRVNNFQSKNPGVSERDASQAALEGFFKPASSSPTTTTAVAPAAGVGVQSTTAPAVASQTKSARAAAMPVAGAARTRKSSLAAPSIDKFCAAGGANAVRPVKVAANAVRLGGPPLGRLAKKTVVGPLDAVARPLVACPVCGRRVSSSNADLNAHIDQCLRGGDASVGGTGSGSNVGGDASGRDERRGHQRHWQDQGDHRGQGDKDRASDNASGDDVVIVEDGSSRDAATDPALVSPHQKSVASSSLYLQHKLMAAAAASLARKRNRQQRGAKGGKRAGHGRKVKKRRHGNTRSGADAGQPTLAYFAASSAPRKQSKP